MIIRPVVDSVFDFERTREALAHLEQGRTKAGKVVVRMGQGSPRQFLPRARDHQ